MDLDGWSQPLSLPAELYSDFSVYNQMVYSKGALFFEMLRYVVGEDAFRRGLREYYARWKLRHVDEHALRGAMEAASHQDLVVVLRGVAARDADRGLRRTARTPASAR